MKLINDIEKTATKLSAPITLMEVCGGHTNTIIKHGIRTILPPNVKLISGPGCPICVTAQEDIDAMITIAQKGIPIATYGDMLRVPGSRGLSLEKVKSQGADIKTIFQADEILTPKNRERVFLGIGFETTTPMTAYLLEQGICVYSTHKQMIPAMKALVEGTKIDGFIDPGHVSCIIGADVWQELGVPQVISGFGKYQIIKAIHDLIEMIARAENKALNNYEEVVRPEGNKKALTIINRHMKTSPSHWRGLGTILGSGWEPIRDELNAKIKFEYLLKEVKPSPKNACRCAEILQGKCEPTDCPIFGTACTPDHPAGACMVSETEGACGIQFKYKQ